MPMMWVHWQGLRSGAQSEVMPHVEASLAVTWTGFCALLGNFVFVNIHPWLGLCFACSITHINAQTHIHTHIHKSVSRIARALVGKA